MCGIAGFGAENQDVINRMTRAIEHRGPDGTATWVGHGASLGHARLAILDPRPEGDQPMWNEEKSVVIVYNGEIMNYRELREGLNCKTGTDTEVLLKLYEREGIDFVRRLRGMFAFGLYDTRTRTWHLARDPSGIKPLFVSTADGTLRFASEMRSLLHSFKKKPSLDLASLSRYARLQYVPGPATLCEGIESLPPGTVLEWCYGRQERRTIQPDVPETSFGSAGAFREAIPSIMDRAVRDHLVSDKPVGLFLSGGTDSSIVLHHMSTHASKPVRTFTVRFEVSEKEQADKFNADADLAKLTAMHYGTEHTEVLLSAADFVSLYEECARSLDQPNANPVSVAQFLLAREAKKHVDVALTGAGGDELFGGYSRYRLTKALATLSWLPSSMRDMVLKKTGLPADMAHMIPDAALAERLLARPTEEISSLARGDWFDGSATSAFFASRWKQTATLDPLRSFMEFDRTLWLVDESLRLMDATTMGSGLEARVPFLDPIVIAASHGTKAKWHVGYLDAKLQLKAAYRDTLPPHLRSLRKAGFFTPLAKWLRREASVLLDRALEERQVRELFDVDAIRKLQADHAAGKTYGMHALSTVIQLGHWCKTVYDVR